MKTKEEIIETLIKVIKEVQQISAEEETEVKHTTIPIYDLPGFDSHRGIETLMTIQEKLDIEIGGSVNLFISKDQKKAISVSEIADRIIEVSKDGK